jgi:hypothetical protein
VAASVHQTQAGEEGGEAEKMGGGRGEISTEISTQRSTQISTQRSTEIK